MQVPDQSESERMIERGTQHQVTTLLSKIKSVLVIEDLNVSGMLQNYHLAQAIGDVGFSPDSPNAFRTASAGTKHKPRVKLAATKQEPNAKSGLSILG